ncbi:tRNA 4-thiouridine(8) synthase ThiI [Methanofervidicoccus sp. A16]|uniref:tRNA uracil 4-sulfurtransferase ThiI n=1 Tax=Methanofervidicoccus sp. A16 TaxID=2607662 RepID=UPI001188D9AE|nr:tRNA uracil 4-sulfurtransferase ThiI [Methanofervidicoccus sp. A16]AXI24786.1 tRNA 4-thiouridine(8) synthase ThiI [Methanofervidicoccus sp. A16]
MYNKVLIRYGEIGLKSRDTRRRFENILKNNIKLALKRYNIEGNIKTIHRRLLLEVEDNNLDRVISILKKVPGIVSFSPSVECNLDMKEIEETAIEVFFRKIEELGNGTITFKVKTQRVKKNFSLTSVEINRRIGESILKNFQRVKPGDITLKVDLKNPQITLGIEIIDKAYIFTEVFRGVGGLPVNSQGKVLVLLSDGIDSPVAGFLMMKRGCGTVLLHLKISDEGLEKVKRIYEVLKDYDPTSKLVVFDYREILKSIRELLEEIGKEKYTCIICKRIMLKIAQEYARRFNCEGIITGDSIGQVASQTLRNIYVISEGVSYPIFRPLIGLDKVEIMDIAKRIGTYDISTSKEIRCFAVPRHPITKGEVEEARELEKYIMDRIEINKIFSDNNKNYN